MEDNDIPPMLDVEKIIKDYVWDSFKEGTTNFQHFQRKFLRQSDFIVNVPMNYFHFDSYRQRVTPKVRPQLGRDGHILDQEENNTKDDKSEKTGHSPSTGSNVVEIKTDFVNDTDLEQTYKFRLEKTRRAVLNVSLHKGYSIGGRVRFQLGLPKLASDSQVEAESGFNINITKQEGEEVEETVVLETTSDIHVKKRSKYVAKVLLAENRVCYNFEIWTRMSMPMGGAPASVTRKKDGKLFMSTTLRRLDKIFEPFKSEVRIETMPSELETENYVVRFKTTGILEGVRLSDQRIILESSNIQNNSNFIDGTTASGGTVSSHHGPIIEEPPDEEDNDFSSGRANLVGNP